jgi:hypothetical protein
MFRKMLIVTGLAAFALSLAPMTPVGADALGVRAEAKSYKKKYRKSEQGHLRFPHPQLHDLGRLQISLRPLSRETAKKNAAGLAPAAFCRLARRESAVVN